MSISALIVTQDGAQVYQQLDTVLIASLVSIFLPIVVNFVTKQSASDGVKSVVNILGVALVSVCSLWINPSDVPVTWQLCVNTALASFVASLAAYKGVWKPTGVSGSVAAASSNFGIGSPPKLQTEQKGAENLGQVDNEPGA
jgi:hypothetical protein